MIKTEKRSFSEINNRIPTMIHEMLNDKGADPSLFSSSRRELKIVIGQSLCSSRSALQAARPRISGTLNPAMIDGMRT